MDFTIYLARSFAPLLLVTCIIRSTDFKYYGKCIINGKAGNAAALTKFLDMLTLSQSGGAEYAQPLALPQKNNFLDYASVGVRGFPCNSRGNVLPFTKGTKAKR
jgi:hypothetical protein